MGCDIHIHVEIKLKGEPEWQHYSVLHIPRYYKLFGYIAGVRDKSVVPIAPAKGIPNDITTITQIDLHTDKYHHGTWLNTDEIEKLEKLFPPRSTELFSSNEFFIDNIAFCWGYLFGNGYNKGAHPLIDDVRMIIWFCN